MSVPAGCGLGWKQTRHPVGVPGCAERPRWAILAPRFLPYGCVSSRRRPAPSVRDTPVGSQRLREGSQPLREERALLLTMLPSPSMPRTRRPAVRAYTARWTLLVLALACGKTNEPGATSDDDDGGDAGGGSGASATVGSEDTGGSGRDGSGGSPAATGSSGSNSSGGSPAVTSGSGGDSSGGSPAATGGGGAESGGAGGSEPTERVLVDSIEQWEEGVPEGLDADKCAFSSGYYEPSECRIVLRCPNTELQIISTCVPDGAHHTCWCSYVTNPVDHVIDGESFPGDDLDPCIAALEECVQR